MTFLSEAGSPMSTASSDRKVFCCDCKKAFQVGHKTLASALEKGYFRCDTCFQIKRRSSNVQPR